MNKVHAVEPATSAQTKVEFVRDAPHYYPATFCELVHASNAVYVATALQVFFLVVLSILYHYFEEHQFIHAVDVFRPALLFVGTANLVGIGCALMGAIMERESLITCQAACLTGLVVLSDLVALGLIVVMAVGSRSRFTQRLPAYLVNEDKFEALLGPFWIYLCAILFHMLAAAITCCIGINRRYSQYLKDKHNYTQLGNEAADRRA